MSAERGVPFQRVDDVGLWRTGRNYQRQERDGVSSFTGSRRAEDVIEQDGHWIARQSRAP